MKQEQFEKLMKQVATGVLLSLVGVSGSALAATVYPECGGTYGPGGTVTFVEDLHCYGDDPALTFIGPINIKMEGYTLYCYSDYDQYSNIGILLDGRQALLHDGSVENCGSYYYGGGGIVTEGGKHHRIERMYVSGSYGDGIVLNSPSVTVKGTESYYNWGDGFQVNSDKNQLSNNSAYDNEGDGFNIDYGSQNKLTNNDAYYNGDDGIDIGSGNANKVVKNTASGNSDQDICDDATGTAFALNDPSAPFGGC